MSYYDIIDGYLKEYGTRVPSRKEFKLRTFEVSTLTYAKLFAKAVLMQAISAGAVYVAVNYMEVTKDREQISLIVAVTCFVMNAVCAVVVYRGLRYTLYRAKMSSFMFVVGVAVFGLAVSMGPQAMIDKYKIEDYETFMAVECLSVMMVVLCMPATAIILRNVEAGEHIRDIARVCNSREHLHDTRPTKQILHGVDVLR